MSLMKKRLPIYLLAILFSSVGLAGSKVATSFLAENVISAAQTRAVDGLGIILCMNFCAFILARLIWRFSIVRYNIEAKMATATIEKMVSSKVLRLPMSYYDKMHSSDFMSKIIFDMERASDIYSSRLRRLLDAIISAVVYLVPMLYFNWILTLCLVFVSFMSFAINQRVSRSMKEWGKKLSSQSKKLTEILISLITGNREAKIFNMKEALLSDFYHQNDTFCEIKNRTNRISSLIDALNCFFDLVGLLAFLAIGIGFISLDLVSLGELIAIYTLYSSFKFCFLEISKYWPQLVNCLANVEQIYTFLNEQEEEDQFEEQIDRLQKEQSNAVVFDNISFAYDKKDIIKKFSLKIPNGICIAITGKSGGGKSTLAKLLLGFYKPTMGEIRIFGEKYSKGNINERRKEFAYVPQEPYLFNMSIAQNIALGKGTECKNVSMDEIIAAAKIANAHDFIINLPDGYQTLVGDRGNTLSGGQRQRIALARAIIKGASILILDEATSALDNESEMMIADSIKKISINSTVIMIAHRQSTIQIADREVSLALE